MSEIDNFEPNLITDTSAFISFTQGMGLAMSDRSTQYYVRARSINPLMDLQQYEILFELNNLAANVIDLLPSAMGSKPPIFGYHDADITKNIQDKINEITPKFIEAATLARLTGGSGVLISSIGSLASSINLNQNITKYSVLEGGFRGDLIITEIDRNIQSESYNKPSKYGIRNSDVNIHASRIIPFYGIKPLTKEQRRFYKYWGMPVLQRCLEKIKALEIADNSIINTLNQFSKVVLEIGNFDELMTTRQGRILLKERVRQTAESWNNDRILAIQAGEKAYRLDIAYSGIDQVLQHLKVMFASSVDIPYGKVFNTGSSNGLGGASSGSKSIDRTDERQWSDYVKNRLVSDWDQSYRYMIDLWLRVLVGDNYGTYNLEYQSILQLSEGEEVDLDYKKAQTNEIYLNTQTVTPDQVAESIAKNVPLGSVVDIDSLQNQTKILNEAQATLGNGENRNDPNLNDEEEHPESLRNIVKDSFSVFDDSTPVKRVITWNSLKIALQYLPFQLRHSKVLTAGYGHIQGLIGADKMALDCWVGTNLNSEFVAIVQQWIDGKFDEEKVILGCDNIVAARDLYCQNMPSEFLGGISETTVKELVKKYSKPSLINDKLFVDTIEDTEYPDNKISELTPVQIQTLKLITAETFTARIDSIDAVYVNPSNNLQWMFTGSGVKFDAELERAEPTLITKVHGAKIDGYSSGSDDQNVTDSELAEFVIDKNCVKGLACGNSCIARSKACKKGISRGAAAAGNAIAEQIAPTPIATPVAPSIETPVNTEPKPVVTPIERTEIKDGLFGDEVNYSFAVNRNRVDMLIDGNGGTIFTVNNSFDVQKMTPRESTVMASKIKSAFDQDVKTRPDGYKYECSAWTETGLKRGKDGNYPVNSPAYRRELSYLTMGFKRSSNDPKSYEYGVLIATVKGGKVEGQTLRSASERAAASQARRAAREKK